MKNYILAAGLLFFSSISFLSAQNWGDVRLNFYQTISNNPNYTFDPLTGTWNDTEALLGQYLGTETTPGTSQQIFQAFNFIRAGYQTEGPGAQGEVTGTGFGLINPIIVLQLQPGQPSFGATNGLRATANGTLNLDPNGGKQNAVDNIWNAIRMAAPSQISVGATVQQTLNARVFDETMSNTSGGIFVQANPRADLPFSFGFGAEVYFGSDGTSPNVTNWPELDPNITAPSGVQLFSAHGHFGAYATIGRAGPANRFTGYIGGGTIGSTLFPKYIEFTYNGTLRINPENRGATTGLGGFAETGLQAVTSAGLMRSGFRVGQGFIFNASNAYPNANSYELMDMFLTLTRTKVQFSSHMTYEKWGDWKGGLFVRTKIGILLGTQGFQSTLQTVNMLGN